MFRDDVSSYDLFAEGRRRLEAGDPRGAAEVLELAAEHEPDKASVHETLGRALFAAQRFAAAQRAFEAAVSLDPADPYARFAVGWCHERQGRLAEAATHYKLACAMSPREDYHASLARVRARLAA